ncbi:hypothetical protein MEO93_20860 [Dolichospermum sp. ST_sed3]|nr:hypothetical protein [Dolichospermum sp. ST_sed3]
MDRERELLEKNDWIVECESPYEIRHKHTDSVATNHAIDSIVYAIETQPIIERLNLIKDAYLANLIDSNKFISEIIKTLEQ